jgi:hypothetical protein
MNGKQCTFKRSISGVYYKKNPSRQSKGKGKAILLQTWTDPKDSRRLRLPYFKTTGT